MQNQITPRNNATTETKSDVFKRANAVTWKNYTSKRAKCKWYDKQNPISLKLASNVKVSISNNKAVQGNLTETAPVFTWDYSLSLSHSSASPADPVWNIKVCKSILNWAFCCRFTLKICNKHLMHLLKPAWDVKVYKGILNGAFGICRFTMKIDDSLGAIIAKTCAWKSRPHWQPCPPGRRLITSGMTLTIHYIVFIT